MTYQFDGDGIEQAGVGVGNRMGAEELGGWKNGREESLIELADMADPAVDEDVIELTDVFSIPEGEESGIIELTEVAEEALDPLNFLGQAEDGRAGAEGVTQDAEQEILELADLATEPGGLLENQSQDPRPEASLLAQGHTGSADAGGFSAPTANEAPSEDDLLDFGDLDLGGADLHTVAAPGVEADDAPEEALFLEDQELVGFADQAQEAAGGFAAEEDAAASQTDGETLGLLDLEGLATPPEEGTIEGDEFSDIFNDLGSGANAAAELAGQPPSDDEPQGRGGIVREMGALAAQAAGLPLAAVGQPAVRAPEEPASLEMENGEEKFILGAGGIRMREKVNDSVQQASQAVVHPVSPADALVVSPEQVEAAVERVVRRMLSHRVEAMLMEVLEKVVSEEIQRIKNALLAVASENDTR